MVTSSVAASTVTELLKEVEQPLSEKSSTVPFCCVLSTVTRIVGVESLPGLDAGDCSAKVGAEGALATPLMVLPVTVASLFPASSLIIFVSVSFLGVGQCR